MLRLVRSVMFSEAEYRVCSEQGNRSKDEYGRDINSKTDL